MAPHPSHHHGQPHIDYAQQSANAASQAANGLFLLSQAHQELSKREEEGRGPSPLTAKRTSVGAVPPGSGKGPGPVPNLPGPSGSGGQKRKSDADLNGAGTGGKGGKKGKKADAVAAAAIMKKDESASPSFSMMDDDDDGEVRMINGKPETEEDKRKNFLERNRQGRSCFFS
jgi:ATF/CREB family transcription factor